MAAVDYFLKITGITGESRDSKHKGEIELLSFSWGASSSAHVATGGHAGRLTFQDFEFTKLFDKASPQIFLKLVQGGQISSMTLSARKSTTNTEFPNADFMKVVFSNVLISFYKEQEPNTDVMTVEAVGALFQKMSLTFIPTDQGTNGAASTAAPTTVNAEAPTDGG